MIDKVMLDGFMAKLKENYNKYKLVNKDKRQLIKIKRNNSATALEKIYRNIFMEVYATTCIDFEVTILAFSEKELDEFTSIVYDLWVKIKFKNDVVQAFLLTFSKKNNYDRNSEGKQPVLRGFVVHR